MEHKFKIGDVVKLNSGSPKLVVASYPSTSYEANDEIEVQWLDEAGHIQRWILPSVCFTKAVLGEN